MVSGCLYSLVAVTESTVNPEVHGVGKLGRKRMMPGYGKDTKGMNREVTHETPAHK